MSKKPKVNLPDAIRALDMVHADLFARIEKLKETKQTTMTIGVIELRALFILVSNAMIDCGDSRLKRSK